MTTQDNLLEIAKETFLASQFNIHRFAGESVSEIIKVDNDQNIIQCKVYRSVQDKYMTVDLEIKRHGDDKAQLVFGDGQGRGISKFFSTKLSNL